MKLGLLEHRDLQTLDQTIHFEVPVPHDIGFEIEDSHSKRFYPMIKRGTPYALAKKSMVFTLSGTTEEDMTSLDLKILERIKKEDLLEHCKLIGTIRVEGLPKRPNGKTKLEVTLSIDEKGGTVKGFIRDLGYGADYKSSDFETGFSPERNDEQVINATLH
jgi:molecular chaperone DnaK (HSP70)